MKMLRLILSKSKWFVVAIVVLGMVNSVLNSGLLIFINNTIAEKPLPYFPEYDWLVFSAMILVSILVGSRFQTYMIRLTNDILYEFELSILKKLRYASYGDFESLGSEKVYTAINDARTLGNVPQLFVNSFNSLIVITCSLGYMFWISPLGGTMVLVMIGLLLMLYLFRNRAAEKDLNELRDLQTDYYRYLRDLISGFKEVKMNIQRSSNIFDKYLIRNRKAGKSLNEKTSIRYMNNELTGSYSWYILLGVIMFALPYFFGLSIQQTSAFIVIVLYLIGPVANLITFVPIVTRVKVALNRLRQYDELLDQKVADKMPDDVKKEDALAFESIEFRDVVYEYYDRNKKKSFVLGPINLRISKGETVFITGGNGSGKTTFIKLLTGLYMPKSGEIFINSQLVTPENYAYYRNQISAIFSDHHIFGENYDDFLLNEDNETLISYIERLKMSEKIKFEEGEYTLSNSLSQGQKKRLAMIFSLMEQKNLMVLDEWAAEQDPHFRAYFYKHLIPFLKTLDKTIVAITHDDKYFDCTDRILKFDYGQIVQDQKVMTPAYEPTGVA